MVHCLLSSLATAGAGAAEAGNAMGASTQEFLVSAAAYAAICLVVFLFFGYFRRLPATHHFYSPKRCVPQCSGSPTLGLCARARVLARMHAAGPCRLPVCTFAAVRVKPLRPARLHTQVQARQRRAQAAQALA